MQILPRTWDPDKVRKDYKGVVFVYDFWSWLTESKAAKKVIELACIEDGMDILEVACGTGIVFRKIVELNPSGKNTGIDHSPAMLNKARKKVENISGNYSLNEGNALDLGFDSGSFDLLINNFMVDLMPLENFEDLASEFYKVLKPGGVLVISTFSSGKKWINGIWTWTAKHFPGLLTGCRPVSFRPYLENSGFTIEEDLELSQNTFPSNVLKARKT